MKLKEITARTSKSQRLIVLIKESQALNSVVKSIRPLASLMARVSKSSQMALFMKVTSRRVRRMVLEEESLLRARYFKANFAMIRWTAKVTSSGKMGLSMRANGVEARNQAKGSSTGPMDRSMRVSSRTMSVMAQEFFTIHVERSLKDSGRQAKRMADVFTHGLTEQSITLSTSTAKSRVRVS